MSQTDGGSTRRRTTRELSALLSEAEHLSAEQAERITTLQANLAAAEQAKARLMSKLGEARHLLELIDAEHQRQQTGAACRCGWLHPCPTHRLQHPEGQE